MSGRGPGICTFSSWRYCFASGALVLPTEAKQRLGSLSDDFQEHGRLSLIPLALYSWLQIPTSTWLESSVFIVGNYSQMILGALALIAFFAKRSIVQRGAVLLFLLVEVLAMVFLWSRPAMLA
jgi:hypothetical protein